jgi:hypothetical protein
MPSSSSVRPFVPESGAETPRNSRGAEFPRSQAELPFATGSDADVRWRRLLDVLRATVEEIGLKQVAYDLDTSPSQVSNALNERDRHHVPARWLIYLARKSRHDEIPWFFAELRGLALTAPPVLTPEEELRRLQEAMTECLSAEVRDVIAKKVRR